MKLQLDILLSRLKREWVWSLILAILTLLDIILFTVNVHSKVIPETKFLSLIGMPGMSSYDFTTLLIFIYQVTLLSYYTYIFYTYELKSAFESVMLRARDSNWIISKISMCVMFIIAFKIIYQLLAYMFFLNDVSFKLTYLLNPVIYQLFISVLIITLINFFKRANYFMYLFVLCLCILVFKWFYLPLVTGTIIVLIIINPLKFRFKKLSINQLR